jgi:hypothetical protein
LTSAKVTNDFFASDFVMCLPAMICENDSGGVGAQVERFFSSWDGRFSGWEGHLSSWEGYLRKLAGEAGPVKVAAVRLWDWPQVVATELSKNVAADSLCKSGRQRRPIEDSANGVP